MTRTQKRVLALAVLVVTALYVTGIARVAFRKTETAIPTARVQRGQVDLTVITNGELQTPKTAMIVAPPIFGTMQIVQLAKAGAAVKAGEIVLEFDPSEQEYNLEQSQSRVAEAEQQIIKAKADAEVQTAQDQVQLLRARFEVRRAELEVGKNELVGEIEGQKNDLALQEAKRRLAQLEQDVKSRQVSNTAGVAVLVQQREQAQMQMQVAQRNIENMQVKSPIDGIVSLAENQDAAGDMRYSGMILPEYREGDQVYPGRMVAQVLDLSNLELAVKVSETDRTNLAPGAIATISMDAMPGRQYTGKLKSVAGLAANSMLASSAVSKFDAVFEVTDPDARLRPGATAQVTVRGASLANVLHLPRECEFFVDGKPVVYVRQGDGFRAHELKVLNQTENRLTIEGLAEGTEVALVNPTVTNQPAAAKKKATGSAVTP